MSFTHPLLALDPNKRITQYDTRMYSAKDGLPSNAAKDIFQDSQGYIWIAGQEGLVRFDGVSFERYIESVFIWDIDEDWLGRLWLGTQGSGVMVFDYDSLVTYDSSDGLTGNVVTHVLVASDSTVWLGTESGLTRFKDGVFTKITMKSGLPNNRVISLLEDSQQRIHVGTLSSCLVTLCKGTVESIAELPQAIFASCELSSGVIVAAADGLLFGVKKGKRVPFFPSKHPTGSRVRAIHEDKDGNLWLATDGSAIVRYNERGFEYLTIENGLEGDNNFFYKIMEDREGSLWFVSDGGIYRLMDNKFITFGKTEGFPSNYGHSICEDSKGRMWAGFRSGGVARFDIHETHAIGSKPTRIEVGAVLPSGSDGLWVGAGPGVDLFDRASFRRVFVSPEGDAVYSLLTMANGNLLIGMGGGVVLYDRGTSKRLMIPGRDESSNVVAMVERSNGEILAGTFSNGLYRLSGESFERVRISDSLRQEGITALYEDTEHVLWVCVDGSGLYRFYNGLFKRITSRNGLAFDRLFSILEDDNGRFWFSGNQGVFSVSKDEVNQFLDGSLKKVQSTSYGHLDGMRESECNGRKQPCAWKSRDGRLWFASIAGIVSVDPNDLHTNKVAPPVYIELVIGGLKNKDGTTQYGKAFMWDKMVRLDPDQAEKGVEFSPNHRDITFEYTALSFAVPERVLFKYQLEGYDNDWIDGGTSRRVTYTNLPKGDYRFKVIARNNDGVWNNEGASAKFSIAPYWHETWWAYSLYAVGMGLVFFGIRQYEMKRVNLRNDLKLTQVRTERLEELDRLKSRFFAGVSHEFRTPLTLIKGPLEELLEERSTRDEKRKVELMLRNTRRLERLVNELLDLAQLESGKMKLLTRPVKLQTVLNGVVASFESLAAQKGIEITLECITEIDSLDLYADPEKLDKILVNLVSNAIKYTGYGGKVSVLVGLEMPENPGNDGNQGRVQIVVRDTGVGIPVEALPHVFDYFYRYLDGKTRKEMGSGIGLALSKQLVDLHRGELTVASEVDEGSEFVLRLPLGNKHLKSEEIATEMMHEADPAPFVREKLVADDIAGQEGAEKPPLSEEGRATILLVEDNADMRWFLRDRLEIDNNVVEATDGEEGVRKAVELIPDLIVSDVMMPKVSGFELCKELKSNESTSHIPVILLTARGSGESKMEGLELGADEYLTKPVNGQELRLRVRNLIERQEKLRERILREVTEPGVPTSGTSLKPADQKFIEKIEVSLATHLPDSDFGPEELANEMAMTRAHLNRRIKSCVGQTTAEFMRSLRLKKAAEFLRNGGSVSETAYSIGFNNLSYFARSFKEQYGQSPSDFVGS